MNFFLIFSRSIWAFWGRQSANKSTTILFVGLFAFACCLLAGFKQGLHIPKIHDEFSYLLAADTFASGRLTNPTHPMWKHFETINVLQKPTYMSRYPPMQGVFLAIGQKFFGHPISGVWLSEALMCASICWMLQAWVSRRWALIGSLIVIFHPGIGAASYWAQSYMGGAVAGIGGAMVLGGVRRIAKEINPFDAVVTGLGMAILVNSRPFEGAITLVPVILLILYWTFFRKRDLNGLFKRAVILPLFIIGLVTLVAMGYYNKIVTGNIFVMPCMLYEQTYSSSPVFIWQKQRPEPEFNNEAMRIYNKEYTEKTYLKYSKENNVLETIIERLNYVILPNITANNLLSIPLLLSLCSLFYLNKWMAFVYAIICFYILVQSTLIWFYFHYFGPLVASFIILIVYGLRVMFCLKIRKANIGKIFTMVYLIFIAYSGFIAMDRPGLDGYTWYKQRQKIIYYLNSIGGKQLVLVRYVGLHSVHNEWVYNNADIDKATVVWARDLGDQANQELFKYFKDRQVWYLIVNNGDENVAEFVKQDGSL